MRNKKDKNRSSYYSALGYAILLSIFLICCKAQTKDIVVTPIPLTTNSPVATLDEKVILRENIIQVLGTDNKKSPRLIKISYDYPERADITITWAINDTASQNTNIVNAQIDATNILKILQNNKTRFIYVILIGTFSTSDQFGNVTEIQAINLGFNKSKLDKINWESFQPSDIYDLADVAKVADEWK